MVNYEGLLGNLAGQLEKFFDFGNYQKRISDQVNAQRNLSRDQLQNSIRGDLAARGIDPGSPLASKAFAERWAPLEGQYAAAEAGAGADYFKSVMSLAPILLSMARHKQDSGGSYSAPPGTYLGVVTNPEVLSGGWNHMPSPITF